MDREEFERLVHQAVNNLPAEFLDRLENIDVVVADKPTRYQIKKARLTPGFILFGLYEGVPLTKRNTNYGFVPPDKITIFQKVIEDYFQTDSEIKAAVENVLKHEVAHHFGISDARLKQIEKENLNKAGD